MFRHTCSSLNFILGDVFLLFDLFYFTWGFKLGYLLLFYFFAYLLLVVLSWFIRFYVHEAPTCQCSVCPAYLLIQRNKIVFTLTFLQ